MIRRLPGSVPSRSKAVMHGGLLTTVIVPSKPSASTYEQMKDALAVLDARLAEAGAGKPDVMSIVVYIADMAEKTEMNRAWEQWVDPDHAPVRACIGAILEPPLRVELQVLAAAEGRADQSRIEVSHDE